MRTRSMGVVCWLTLACPALVSAQSRVVVSDFKGPNAKPLRSAVVSVLEEHDMELVPPTKAAATARTVGAELDTESGRVRVAKKLHLRAFVQGGARVVKRRIQVTITVFGGSDGMQASQFTTTVPKAAVVKDVRKRLWSAIGSALVGDSGPPDTSDVQEPEAPARPAPVTKKTQPPRPAPVRVPAPTDEETPPGIAPLRSDESMDQSALAERADQEEASSQRPSAFDVSLGGRLSRRSFGYNEALPGLRGYTLHLGPSAVLRGHWYPGAHVTDGVLAHIGLDLRGEFLIGVSSKNKDGQKFSNNSHTFGIGVRARVPLGKLELGAVAGFGQHTFGFAEASGKIDPDVPDVTYNFVRLGLDARWPLFGPLSLQLATAYLVGLSQGEIAERAWFPHTTGNGFEAEIGAAYAMSRMIGLELSLAVQRYFMSLNPEPKDPGVLGSTHRVAGGALDQYLSLQFGVVIRP